MKYVCIHGHFYQPPRENPWLEEVELQDSAYPFHDWNEKITDQCYAPNAFSRIKNERGQIINIVNNYAKMSFNFGPTLLSWVEYNNPEIYKAILKADELSITRFGHGSAMAQVYNHMIMPLANKRDKITQVRWGISDFEKRFQRKPEGMWLPETAVDTETLQVLADHGIKFTILSPHQAEKFRHKKEKDWHDVSDGSIDPKKAYYVKLPDKKKINIFFYDGVASKELAFQDLLNNGVDFGNRLMSGFTGEENPQIMHIATDGETYGHHRSYGDMSLAYCLNYIENNNSAELTNYGQFLEKHPPEHEVVIKESTSWSCMHGVKRWWTDCGCNSGNKPGWQQKWREPLRNAFDWLRDQLVLLYEKEAPKFFDDLWEARNNYISVVNDRSEGNVEQFFKDNAKELSHDDKKTALKLLEIQRNNLLMYTSCGWFFDEISGIETVQVIQYAARSIQLAEELSGEEYEKEFVKMLEKAPSNVLENGANVYYKFAKPAFVDLHKIGAHYAVSSLFKKSEKQEGMRVFSYNITDESYESFYAGKFRLVTGKSKIFSEILWEETVIIYGVLWLGDHNIVGGVKVYSNEEEFKRIKEELKENFDEADIQQVIKLINDNFGKDIYSLRTLFKDEQRKIINHILQDSVEKAKAHYKEIYEDNYTVSTYLHDIGVSNPPAIQIASEIVINQDLQKIMRSEEKDLQHLKQLVEDVDKFSVELDTNLISMEAGRKIAKEVSDFLKNPDDTETMDWLIEFLELIYELPLKLNLWEAQNLVFSHGKEIREAKKDNQDEGAWINSFDRLCELLQLKLENDQ